MQAKSRLKSKKKINILVADREGIFRLGLKRLLSAEDDLRVVAQAENVPQVMAMLKTFQPDLIIVQQEIASDGNRSLLAQIRHQAPECKIIAIASLFSEQMKKELVEAGVSGLICKADQPEAFVKSVHRVLRGETVLPHSPLTEVGVGIVSDKDRQPRPVDTLTRRERTIVSCLTQGWRNREIASHLDIVEQTVKNHLRSIYDKVGVSDRLELVLYAIHQRLELPKVT
ncbi:MAG TPA: response regulator transcription factor [Terriglobia bacterium]|nr:response regulator transcription factor [Terriglobia bacterium]